MWCLISEPGHENIFSYRIFTNLERSLCFHIIQLKWSAPECGVYHLNGHFSWWLCVGPVVPALMWVWFIVHSKPWVGQRPGEMEGTSTTGAFPSLMTVKRKGDTSKHSSSPRLFQHPPALHCITLPAHIQEQTPVTPLLMIYAPAFLVQICASGLRMKWNLRGLDRCVGWQ